MLSNGRTAIDGLSTRSRFGAGRADGVAREGAAAPSPPRRPLEDAIGAHRRGDVLDALLAEVVEGRLQALAHRALDGVGHRHAARLGDPFQARGDVDAVAVDRAVGLLHDVAEVDADAKLHAAIGGDVGRAACQLGLDRQRRDDRAARRLEHREHRIAGHVDDAAAMRIDGRAEDRACVVERSDRAALVAAHQARVAGHVGHQDRGQALARLGLAHAPLRSGMLMARMVGLRRESGRASRGRDAIDGSGSECAASRPVTMQARVAQFSSQRRRSRFRLPSPVCLRLALAQASSRPMN